MASASLSPATSADGPKGAGSPTNAALLMDERYGPLQRLHLEGSGHLLAYRVFGAQLPKPNASAKNSGTCRHRGKRAKGGRGANRGP